MNKLIVVLVSMIMLFAVAVPTIAADPNAVKGTLSIDFKSRTQLDESGNPQKGVKDIYILDLQVTDTLGFQGTIEHLPMAGTLMYNLNLLVANPANPVQRVAIGKLIGGVPIDKKGVYNYDNGSLRIAVDARGKAAGFESRFRGSAAGKPPKSSGLVARIKKQATTLIRQVKGKTVKLVVTDYDIMACNGLVLAAGPVKTYPETIVNGEMLYDYERSAWYFRGLTMTYMKPDGKTITDKLTGNIKWVESPQRKTNGEGEYQFDVRFNEPEQQAGEAAVFQPVDDEAAFFAVDNTLSSLKGTAKYKDQMRGETVASSAVTIDLVGNKLTKQQIVNATKLIWLVSVVPMNSE